MIVNFIKDKVKQRSGQASLRKIYFNAPVSGI